MAQSRIEPFVTAKDVGDIVNMDEKAVLQLAKNGGLPCYELGDQVRFRLSEIEAALQQRRRPGPQASTNAAGSQRKVTERHYVRREFWTDLLNRAKARTSLHAHIKPGIESWIAVGAGRRGLFYQYQIRNDATQALLAIDRGQGSDAENKRIFDQLHAQKPAIEQVFGGPLEWDRGPDTRRSAYIRYTVTTGGLRTRDRWPKIQDELVDAMVRLEAALRTPISQLMI